MHEGRTKESEFTRFYKVIRTIKSIVPIRIEQATEGHVHRCSYKHWALNHPEVNNGHVRSSVLLAISV